MCLDVGQTPPNFMQAAVWLASVLGRCTCSQGAPGGGTVRQPQPKLVQS